MRLISFRSSCRNESSLRSFYCALAASREGRGHVGGLPPPPGPPPQAQPQTPDGRTPPEDHPGKRWVCSVGGSAAHGGDVPELLCVVPLNKDICPFKNAFGRAEQVRLNVCRFSQFVATTLQRMQLPAWSWCCGGSRKTEKWKDEALTARFRFKYGVLF